MGAFSLAVAGLGRGHHTDGMNCRMPALTIENFAGKSCFGWILRLKEGFLTTLGIVRFSALTQSTSCVGQ